MKGRESSRELESSFSGDGKEKRKLHRRSRRRRSHRRRGKSAPPGKNCGKFSFTSFEKGFVKKTARLESRFLKKWLPLSEPESNEKFLPELVWNLQSKGIGSTSNFTELRGSKTAINHD